MADNQAAGTGEGRKNVPKLKELLRRQRRDSEGQNEAPSLDFIYTDTDSLMNELAELYSYTEQEEFELNAEQFYEDFKKIESQPWKEISPKQKNQYMMRLLDRLETVSVEERRNAARSVLYLCQGMFKESNCEEDLLPTISQNVLLIYRSGVFAVVQQLLLMEAENIDSVQAALQKPSISIADSIDLRICINILYTVVEVIRINQSKSEEMSKAAEGLRLDLDGSKEEEDGGPFAYHIFEMILKFCAGSAPHYPIKKLLLLLWKVILFTLGGFDELLEEKKQGRVQAGLSPSFEEQNFENFGHPPEYYLRASSPQREKEERKRRNEISTAMDKDEDLEQESILEDDAKSFIRNELLLRPKVRQKDVQAFLQTCRAKFVGYQLTNDITSTAGLPRPILEGFQVLKSHVYVSLAEIHIKREEDTTNRPFSKGKTELPQTRAELLYKALLPVLPQYMITLLKILLASAPTAKAKTDSINILTDVLPPEMPTTVLKSMQLAIDVNRHKEILVKSISALILLFLKHFKVNHIYQFEFVSQHLVFANCIPLVLKFFNQNTSAYVAAKNSVPVLDFPACVLEEKHEVTAESLESGNGNEFCWRNLFSCINLLRILQKLTKWKHSRTMMLVVFKSAPILKRALKINEENLQLYVLKLLKTQIKYLGRNWRKSNMKIMSMIYHKVRHRLNDDWAFGNDLDARPWDFQTEECALRQNVDLFNYHHYDAGGSHYPSDFQPVDNDLHSCLSQTVTLTKKFKKDYEKWLDREIFKNNVDWEELLEKN
ncbi:striatin-interacting protein 2-like [Rhopilema esculentum]|uniref:striatin-interacting protein 2-like n=1 Tax=Rhopilema esculentum TaxID=499914 RepID=UPI0031E184D2|eukprot:gene13371-4228_t